MDDKERLTIIVKSFKLPIPNNADVETLKDILADAMVRREVVVVKTRRLSAPPKKVSELPLTPADTPEAYSSAPIVPVAMVELENGMSQASQAAALVKAAQDGVPFCEECVKAKALQAASDVETSEAPNAIELVKPVGAVSAAIAAAALATPAVAGTVIDSLAKKEPDFDVLFELKDQLGNPMKALPYIANEQSVEEKDLHLKQGVTDTSGKTPIVSNIKNEALNFYAVWAKINVNTNIFKVK